jgi:hypothetical protein
MLFGTMYLSSSFMLIIDVDMELLSYPPGLATSSLTRVTTNPCKDS